MRTLPNLCQALNYLVPKTHLVHGRFINTLILDSTDTVANIMFKHLSVKESIFFQPPSFNRKRNYELHQVLGVGTFGKVVVRGLGPFPSYHRDLIQPFFSFCCFCFPAPWGPHVLY